MTTEKYHVKILVTTILSILARNGSAAEYLVTENLDDGSGLTPDTLSWAIIQANSSIESDQITLMTDIVITGVMKRLIDSDIIIRSTDTMRSISGNNLYRPLFIKSGRVVIQNVEIKEALAQGGSASGAGAGLGGAIFVYDGNVTLRDVIIADSIAQGGLSNGNGGGGMYGDGVYAGGGGGLFGNASGSTGGYGGYGNYEPTNFGKGGAGLENGSHGGFGGGGGSSTGYYGSGGNGGFGGGGGDCYCLFAVGQPGSGGFGGSGGHNYEYGGRGSSGYGAGGGFGAGLGGAVFIRSGTVNLAQVQINDNSALALSSASGLGGGLFVLHTLSNSNGNNQGMPDSLPVVTACEVALSNNQASNDEGSIHNNDDIFDLAQIINEQSGALISSECDDIIFENGFEN